MARPSISKTQLGQRLTLVREALGYKTRKEFSIFLNIHPETMGGYERGDSVPDMDFFQIYKQRFSVNLNWLITGEGEMFTNAAATPTSMREVDILLLMNIAGKVEDVYKGLGQRPTNAHITGVAGEIYNSMLKAGTDFNDNDELTTTISLEMIKLKKRIINGDINPNMAAASP